MTTLEDLRTLAKKYIDTADEDSLRRVKALLEIDQHRNEWWNNKNLVKELDARYEALDSGEDKGLTIERLKYALDKHKNKLTDY